MIQLIFFQVVFVPVDVRNFIQNGLIIHSYPVKTGFDKLLQYFNDASRLVLSLFVGGGSDPLGKAYIILSSENTEGYFPILNFNGDEIATIRVKIDYVDASIKEKESNMDKTVVSKSRNANNKSPVKSKPTRVTFPTHVEQITFPCDSISTNSHISPKKSKSREQIGKQIMPMIDLTKKFEDNLSFISSCSNNSKNSNINQTSSSLDSASMTVKISSLFINPLVYDKIKDNYKKSKIKTKPRPSSAASSEPKLFIFVKLTSDSLKERDCHRGIFFSLLFENCKYNTHLNYCK